MPEAVVRMERVKESGFELSMHLVRLAGGGALVHSPTYVGDETFARVEAFGPPTVLFAPNFFHHLGLPKFRARWPEARVVAGERALARLTKQGHTGVEHVSAIAGLLPDGMRFLECAGARSGETFLSFDDPARGRSWLVCDAFFHAARPVTGFSGFALRLLKTVPGFCIGTTFLTLALDDKRAYRRFLRDALEAERPRVLHMSHGVVLEGDDLVERIATLADARIGR